MPEDYIRPPIVALERPNHKAAQWRFRAVLILLLVGVAVGAFFVARAIVNSGQNGNAQGARHITVAAISARRG